MNHNDMMHCASQSDEEGRKIKNIFFSIIQCANFTTTLLPRFL